MTTTGTFKLVKGELRKQAFHLDQLDGDEVYVQLPRTSHYQLLDQKLYESIRDGLAGY